MRPEANLARQSMRHPYSFSRSPTSESSVQMSRPSSSDGDERGTPIEKTSSLVRSIINIATRMDAFVIKTLTPVANILARAEFVEGSFTGASNDCRLSSEVLADQSR